MNFSEKIKTINNKIKQSKLLRYQLYHQDVLVNISVSKFLTGKD